MVQPVLKSRLYQTVLLITVGLILFLFDYGQAGVGYSTVGYRTTTVYSNGPSDQWTMSDSYTGARLSTDILGLSVGLNMIYSRPQGDIRWGYNENNRTAVPSGFSGQKLIGRINFREPYFKTDLSFMTKNRKISSSFGWQYKGNNRDGLSVAVWLQPLNLLGGGLRLERSYPLPKSSELYYLYENSDGSVGKEGGEIDWAAPAKSIEYKIRLQLMERLFVESIIRESSFEPDTTNKALNDYMYQGRLDGLFYDGCIKAKYRINSYCSAGFKYRQTGIHSTLKVYENGRKFANFGVVRADVELWSGEVRYHKSYLKFAIGDANGDLKGNVDAWPFVDGLLIFLGEKRHFIGRADVDWKLTTVGSRIINNSWLDFNIVSNYLNINPALRYVTWRPQYWGMGYDDLRSTRLDIIRADLLQLVLQPTLKFGRWAIDINISQWIPVLVRESNKSGSAEGSSGEAPDSTASENDSNDVWGGFNAGFTLRARF